MIPSIAFVGAGPTTIYTFCALLNHASAPFAVTIFEEQPVAGRGTPYRPGWNDPAMLSNIASIEIPPLEDSLIAWLERQPSEKLVRLGIDPAEIDDHAFYPRLALGQFFKEQFDALIERARARGNTVEIRTRCRVADAVHAADGITLSLEPHRGAPGKARFDYLVIATGHQWPEQPEVRPGYFLSPWPASALAEVPPCAVGIRGSSLTAIDAAVALAVTHGAFVEDGDAVRYEAKADAAAFHMTMMSRKGLLPEADFYHPVPYEPLAICTPEAVERLIAEDEDDLLDRIFALFKRELLHADPEYAARTGLADLELANFCDRYFADRMAADPFNWAVANLAEAKRNYADVVTVPWRYAILRMHEVVALAVPHLNEDDFERFSCYFKPIFVDDYATVPHQSIARMLALHGAGKLDLLALGEDYRIDSHRAEGGAVLRLKGRAMPFSVFIEATGQRVLSAQDFPFPSLLRQGVVREEAVAEGAGPRGIVVDDIFHPLAGGLPADRLFCLSIPFLLGRHPFIQGITSSHEMGNVVGAELAAAIGRAPSGRVEEVAA